MKSLILNRHAKSDWGNPEISDFDRPLNDRGNRDAPIMAERFFNRNLHPELIISSPALRAITTAKIFAQKLNLPIKQEIEIYNGSEKFFKSNLDKFDDNINTILAFGHNPDFTYLATYYSGTPFSNIPTCGIVCIEFSINSWKDVNRHNGSVAFFDYPKNSGD